MTYELYNNLTRRVEFIALSLEDGLRLILDSKGKFSLIINDIKESDVFEIKKDSLLNVYVPESIQLGRIIYSSAFGWKTNLYVGSHVVDGGSYCESIFEEARLWSKENPDKLVKLEIWAIDGQGLPLGLNNIR